MGWAIDRLLFENLTIKANIIVNLLPEYAVRGQVHFLENNRLLFEQKSARFQ